MRRILFVLLTAAFSSMLPVGAAAAERPSGWHARDRIFAGAPVVRTVEQIRAMRVNLRPDPPSDPALACYYQEHIVNRCPQNERP